MRKIIQCRCCKGKKLLKYLNLGKQPLANSYHKKERLISYPLEVNVCRNCFHSQLSIVVPPHVMFKNYLYVSGTTETFRDHCKNLAKDAVLRFSHNNLNVLDIACNDGTLLEYFKALDCNVLGIDPAENLRSLTKEKNIPVIVTYWGKITAESINKKFHIITGTNVFAHVHNVDDFLDSTKAVLTHDGIVILEFPYANTMINHNEFDTIYHEHLSYFLVHSFKALIERKGFFITDVLLTPIHGGSIRFFLKVGRDEHSYKVNELIENEKKNGLLKIGSYKKFTNHIKENKKTMQKLIKKLSVSKQKIIGYGASAKGNTMLNYFKIKLDYIVDDNFLKWNYLTPGSNIPICSPNVIKNEKKRLYIVILSWNFYHEIVKKIIKIRKHKKDITIVYIPKVKKIPISSSLVFSFSA